MKNARLRGLGINAVVLVIALAVFGCSFIGLTVYGNAMKPETVQVLVLTRDIQPGERLAAADLEPVAVFADPVAEAYVKAGELEDVVGHVVVLPQKAGQPLLRGSVLAAPPGQRLSSLLADEEGMVLFPLPLSLSNVIAPEANDIEPGDRVFVTALVSRPPLTAEESAGVPGALPAAAPTPAPVPAALSADLAGELERLRPPIAKILFPQGVRVVAVYGKSPAATSSATDEQSQFGDTVAALNEEEPRLLLRVPVKDVEPLTAVLGQADLVLVGLIGNADAQPEHTPGFTYKDFEAWVAEERVQAFLATGEKAATESESETDTGTSSGAETGAPEGAASPTPTPAAEPASWTFTADELAWILKTWSGENGERQAVVNTLGVESPPLAVALLAVENEDRAQTVLDALKQKGYVADDGRLNEALAACLDDWAAGGSCVVTENTETGDFQVMRVEEQP